MILEKYKIFITSTCSFGNFMLQIIAASGLKCIFICYYTWRNNLQDVIILKHFKNQWPELKNTLVLFSDGCPEHNNNYLMVRVFYWFLHGTKLSTNFFCYFVIRGYFRFRDDQDLSLIEDEKRRRIAETIGTGS